LVIDWIMNNESGVTTTPVRRFTTPAVPSTHLPVHQHRHRGPRHLMRSRQARQVLLQPTVHTMDPTHRNLHTLPT
jgi:hypothetical protein